MNVAGWQENAEIDLQLPAPVELQELLAILCRISDGSCFARRWVR